MGGLINGVFLVALCLSIFLDAIHRFVEPQEVSDPILVIVVGGCGLLSNFVGLFLFHDHGHAHSHAPDAVTAAEEGSLRDGPPALHVDSRAAEEAVETSTKANIRTFKTGQDDAPAGANPMESPRRNSYDRLRHNRRSSGSRSRFLSINDDNIHPASLRRGIIDASRLEDIASADVTESEEEESTAEEAPSEDSPLLNKQNTNGSQTPHGSIATHRGSHAGHRHAAKASSKHSHGHGDLNMQGLFLHVMGDALGNVGVIASGLFIWLTPFWWRYYSDPLVSLIITILILGSAIPLCKAAARILLQGTPPGIDILDISHDIRQIPGIIDAHHFHVWQLSDTKVVASLHIKVNSDLKSEGSARYMALVRSVRRCLHEYGIHSSTIQPEFVPDPAMIPDCDGHVSQSSSAAGSLRGREPSCMLQCGDDCADGSQCCKTNDGG